MKSKPIILLFITTMTALTIYMVSQFGGLAANTEFNRDHSRNIIAQIHLTKVQFVVDSNAVSRGYFMANLTFENPTDEKLTFPGGVHGELYSYNSSTGSAGWKIADGWTYTTLETSPNISKIALRMDLDLYSKQNSGFAIVPNYKWWIYYNPKLGTVSYQMTAVITDSSIQYGEPTFPQDEIYTVADTYAASIVGAWILGFEIVAVSLIRRGGAQKSGALTEGEKHNVVLSIIYAVQGLGIIAAQIYYTFIQVLIPPPPLPSGYIPYGLLGVAGFAAGILFLQINAIALAFLAVAAGLFFQTKWAMKAALPISLISVIVLLLIVATTLSSLFNPSLMFIHTIALAILFSAIAIAHGIVVYVVALRKPRSAI